MAYLAVPQPYDFALSTERFRTFGPDPANLWHEGGLHRVVGVREVRIEAGTRVDPLDGERVVHAWSFPARERVAAASEDELLSLGFSRRKAEYVLGLARSELDLEGLAA